MFFWSKKSVPFATQLALQLQFNIFFQKQIIVSGFIKKVKCLIEKTLNSLYLTCSLQNYRNDEIFVFFFSTFYCTIALSYFPVLFLVINKRLTAIFLILKRKLLSRLDNQPLYGK